MGQCSLHAPHLLDFTQPAPAVCREAGRDSPSLEDPLKFKVPYFRAFPRCFPFNAAFALGEHLLMLP